MTSNDVHATLKKHILAEGYDFVCDLEKSHGCYLYDSKGKREFLDMFSFFASLPVGFNHPKISNPTFITKLGKTAINKVSNPDVYTVEFAETVDAFGRYAIPKELPHLFLIDSGTLAIENALKVAFDWKVKKNFARGSKDEKGRQVIHFKNAFHGRSGYTLSLTNTADPRKYQYFPRFDWPRIDPPSLTFEGGKPNTAAAASLEERALEQIHSAIKKNPDDIAALLIEPIQAEGGDNHFRAEFLKELRTLCDQHEIMLIFDEVQTGFGLTGKFWAYEHFHVVPDALAFGKKSQVCGILVGRRVDEIEKNVFVEQSRINSTFGGNLVDMVRVAKILEIIHTEKLIQHAATVGKHLLSRLVELERESDITNARGLGLMCAIDFPSPETRDQVRKKCYEKGMIILACGTRSLRFRPTLTVTTKEIDKAIDILRETLKTENLFIS
ncbi:MAG: L-lysine 6-transaminase [Deltaproteobacteria bacterium RIFCSPLOWO2_02_FULL_44_10]|nr:MAG: L-lysine 6-transaminase [Deltaproteobacteria bacterium RIFCSPHIGHO2_02_FULL_44_16]OGQ47606.1 MAG: L-lysine 6-transaminase [Deltaproteobacteria bacterium RIFCSPLOWO2_02_FULL_44_10]